MCLHAQILMFHHTRPKEICTSFNVLNVHSFIFPSLVSLRPWESDIIRQCDLREGLRAGRKFVKDKLWPWITQLTTMYHNILTWKIGAILCVSQAWNEDNRRNIVAIWKAKGDSFTYTVIKLLTKSAYTRFIFNGNQGISTI